MKFYIKKLILWLQNGQKRELLFKDNKINVITGESGTGKSAILDIIDYCLLSSTHSISENIINENVIWYGLKLFIDDEVVTIARKNLLLVECQMSFILILWEMSLKFLR